MIFKKFIKSYLWILLPAILLVWPVYYGFSALSEGSSQVYLQVGEYCGDGVVNGAEQCDDGGNVDGDGCSATCVTEFCGDAIVNNSEICDGNNEACTIGGYAGTRLCNPACNGWNACISAQFCGDGLVNGLEACDDGNNIDCDGCRSDCTRLDNFCGDGYAECGEECDGSAGVTSGHICASGCMLESAQTENPSLLVFTWLSISNIFERVGSNEAVINWQTNKYAICNLAWGDTQEVSGELIQETDKKYDHRALINGLNPDQIYYYKIICRDSWGQKSETTVRSLKTVTLVDIIPPANPSSFSAELNGVQADLSWKNPTDTDFQGVSVIRKKDSLPTSKNDGTVIYIGSGENFQDSGLALGARYYYVIFAYDNDGNYSSGAVASIEIPKQTVLPEEITGPGGSAIPVDSPVESPEDGQTDDEPDISQPDEISEPDGYNSGEQGKEPTGQGEETPDQKTPADDLAVISPQKIGFSAFYGRTAIEMNANQEISVFPGLTLAIDLDQSVLKNDKAIIRITLTPEFGNGKTEEYLLRTIGGSDPKAVITMPEIAGKYRLDFGVSHQGQNYDKIYTIGINIENYGRIYRKRLFNRELRPISGAAVELRRIDDGSTGIWRAVNYGQSNPAISGANGEFGFMAPNGTYSLSVSKDGFFRKTVDNIEIKNNVLNRNIELSFDYRSLWKIIPWLLIIIILVILYVYRRKRIHNNKG